jgi:Flp pilus assembly protein TadD
MRLNDEGLSLYAAGELPGAREKFEAALAHNPADRIVRRNLAYTMTRLAWQEVVAERYDEAVGLFKQAGTMEPGDGSILLGLGVTDHLRGDDRRAKTFLLRALDGDADLVLAHKVLGEIAYREDDLVAAAARLETLLRLDPSDMSGRARLDRVRNEARLQEGFQRLEGRHFTVKFANAVEPAFAGEILRMLEAAYQDVGRVLDHFPAGKVPVILHPEEEMSESMEAPAWAQGMFDGKIRLPVGGVSNPEALNPAIRHEYTHALVHDWTRGRAPTWLTEGLAVTFEGRDMRPEWALLREADHVIPLRELHGSYLSLPPLQRSLAYAESVAAVRFLLDHYGARAAQAFMKQLSAAKGVEQALQEAVGLTYSDFQAAFVRDLVGVGGARFAGPPSTITGSSR